MLGTTAGKRESDANLRVRENGMVDERDGTKRNGMGLRVVSEQKHNRNVQV